MQWKLQCTSLELLADEIIKSFRTMVKKRNESVFYNSTQHLKGIHTQNRAYRLHILPNAIMVLFRSHNSANENRWIWHRALGSFEHSTRCARCVEIWNVCVCIRCPLTFGHPSVKHVVNGALKQFSKWLPPWCVNSILYRVCVICH